MLPANERSLQQAANRFTSFLNIFHLALYYLLLASLSRGDCFKSVGCNVWRSVAFRIAVNTNNSTGLHTYITYIPVHHYSIAPGSERSTPDDLSSPKMVLRLFFISSRTSNSHKLNPTANCHMHNWAMASPDCSVTVSGSICPSPTPSKTT
jgi:hypothetical protein